MSSEYPTPSVSEEQIQKAKRGMIKKSKKKTIDDYLYHIVIGVFLAAVLITLASEYYQDTRQLHQVPVIETTLITKHNQYGDSSYEIYENDFFVDWNLQDAKSLLQSTLINKGQSVDKCVYSAEEQKVDLKDEYNFRTAYPECLDSNNIQMSRNCSSGYIMSTLSVIEDRMCRQTGNTTAKYSVQQWLSCHGHHCGGGVVSDLLDQIEDKGLMAAECLVYQAEQTACPAHQCNSTKPVHSHCQTTSQDQVKRQIQLRGPVVATIAVYRDFLLYQKGIYKPLDSIRKFKGQQVVKVVGWGRDEKKRDYWLVENTWGNTWGEDGLARIYMGFKEIGLDNMVIAPVLNNITKQ